MEKKTKELALASILTALSLLITYSPLKLVIPPFTLTLGAHVPTMLAMFVGPWVAVMTIVGSCIGFAFNFAAPMSFIVIARAATHLIFSLVGIEMLKKNRNIILIIVITAILHSIAEGIVSFLLTPILIPSDTLTQFAVALPAGEIALFGTLIHHIIDVAITAPILTALTKAKIIKRRYF